MVKPAVMIAGMCLLSASVASATTILDTNFDSANGSYSDGAVINSSGSITQQMTVKLGSAAQTAGSSLNISNGQVIFTDNANTDGSVANGPSIVKDMSAVASIGYQKANDYLNIQFDLTPLVSGTRPKLQIMVNDGTYGVGSSANAVYMLIDSGGSVYYMNGGSAITGSALAANTNYHFNINVNYSNSTWDLIVTNGAGGVMNLAGLATRATVNTTSYTAGNFIMNGGASGSYLNPNAFIGVDNLQITASSTTAAVPEPAAFSLLAIGVAGLLLGRRSR